MCRGMNLRGLAINWVRVWRVGLLMVGGGLIVMLIIHLEFILYYDRRTFVHGR